MIHLVKSKNDIRDKIIDDITEGYPVNMDGKNFILTNKGRILFGEITFYSFDEMFSRIDINNCKYLPNIYTIKDMDE